MRLHWLALALLALACAACTTVEPAQARPNGTNTGPIGGAHTAGQTFVAQQDGLTAVDVMLATYGRQNSGTLTLHLRAGPGAPDDLRTVAVDMAQIEGNQQHRFAFAPLPDSAGKRYYFELDAPDAAADNAVTAWRGDPGGYLDGALYLDGAPVEGQLTFQLVYDAGLSAAGVARGVLASAGAALGVIAFLLLPGLALLLWSGWRGDGADPARDWRSALLLAPALTVALVPVLLLLARLAGTPLGPWAPWALVALGAVGVATSLWHRRARFSRAAFEWSDLALLAAATAIVVVRFAVVRAVAVPLWDDGQEHTVIVQLLLDHGGLFSSWEPYAAFTTFTTQFGFHAVTAFLQWLSGWPVPRAVVLSGQVFNALAALCLYPLAARVGGSRWAGVFAVLAAGLLSPMPMAYVNWGRYPQLAGQVVLPAALWCLAGLLPARPRLVPAPAASEEFPATLMALAGFTAAGMLLGSYRMLHFYAVFAIVWVAVTALRARWTRREWAAASASAGAAAVVGGLLFLPWQIGLGTGELVGTLQNTVTGIAAQPTVWQNVLAEYDFLHAIPEYGPQWLFTLALAGLAWAFVRRRGEAVAVALWIAGMLLIPLLRLVRFPTAAFFQVFALVIALYVPIALLVGWLAAELVRLIAQDQPRAAAPLALAVVVLGTVWGYDQRAAVLDRSWALVTTPDEQAMTWIRANVPAGAVFEVNSRLYHGDLAVIGTDAGVWLPLLAGRTSLVPPLYAFTNEAEERPGYRERLLDLTRALLASPAPAPGGVSALCAMGVTHVYVGQLHGSAGRDADSIVLDPEALAASPAFTTLYHADRVWVLGLTPAACAGAGTR